MSRIAAYRRYAAHCLGLAEKTSDDSERRVLIEMAAGWHELALMLDNYMNEHHGAEMPISEFERPKPKRAPPRAPALDLLTFPAFFLVPPYR
jgi:hypothetical protein